jgi:chromate transporter
VLRTTLATFGSGNTTSVLIGRALENRGWLGRAQFDACFTIARAAPGTNLMAFAAIAGWYIRGWPGACVAVAALSIPASVAAVLVTLAFSAWSAHPAGGAAIGAATAAIIGIIAAGSWLIVQPQARSVRTAVLLAGGLLASRYLSPVSIMALAFVAGYFWRADE